jgi:hypothetical protein
VVRYWRPHPELRRKIRCEGCDQTFPNRQVLTTHQLARKHGPYGRKEMQVQEVSR